MPASYTNNGDGTITIKFEYTAATQKVMDLGEDAAHQVYIETPPSPDDPIAGGAPPPFDSLSNQEKLDLLDGSVKWHLLNLARRYWIAGQVNAAQSQAVLDAEVRYLP